jgi:hypothetical protein
MNDAQRRFAKKLRRGQRKQKASPRKGVCPWCGGEVVSLGFTVTPDRVKHVEGKGYLWTGPPRGGTP